MIAARINELSAFSSHSVCLRCPLYGVDKGVVGVVAGRSEPDKEKQTSGLNSPSLPK